MNKASLTGDRCLSSASDDRLGFSTVASHIATALMDRSVEDGLVVGLEGSWGSGKSSLLFLIEQEIAGLAARERPAWINFRPWLIGNSETLLANLFSELSKAIDRAEHEAGNATRYTVAQAKTAGEALRKFAQGLGRAGGVIEVAGDASGFVPLKLVGKGLKALQNFTKKDSTESDLASLKLELVKSLKNLKHRFVVAIDDVDRLEPNELIEVLRLIRSVADFPNVIYILCYDADILEHSVQQAAKISNGRSYLEKIIQLTVMVPDPEPFQLRQWFTEELAEFASANEVDQQTRLSRVVDLEGGRQLRTPRSVIRALDALRVYWPPLRSMKADVADAVWVQLIKNGNPKLYRWIEEYCSAASTISMGVGRVEDALRRHESKALLETVSPGYFDDTVYRYFFAEQLPGLAPAPDEKTDPFRLHQKVGSTDRDKAIREQRLGSPDHYRLYFALGAPSYALSQHDFDALWAAAQSSPADAAALLLSWHGQDTFNSLSKADVFLERLRDLEPELISSKQSRSFLLAFSNIMDEAYDLKPFDFHWVNSIWDRAERVIPLLLSKVARRSREAIVKAMFANGSAIGWLTSVFRRETFAQGRFGERRRPETEWLFSAHEMDLITEIMVDRYKSMTPREITRTPNPINVLYAWLQAGDQEGVRAMVARASATDDGFVEIAEALRTKSHSSDGTEYTLNRDELVAFLDYSSAKSRIQRLAKTDVASELKDRARSLNRALMAGER